jgi:hypothetical protein
MTNVVATMPVKADELLSRYLLQRSHFRKDNTLKPDPFIPHPYPDLSVTRNLGLDDDGLWRIGEDVASQTGKVLQGRAETQALTYLEQRLEILADPVPGNPNHANVTGWPSDKPSQKIIAMEIAAKSLYIPAAG